MLLVGITACTKDDLPYNGELGEGESNISAIVEFRPLTVSALGRTRTAGDAIKNIENLLEYVGKNINEVEANPEEIKNFKKFLSGNTHFELNDFKGKLFPIEEAFSPEEIKNQRIYLQGEYTDAERKLFFSTRDDGTILFNKCNYEQTAKPSVVSMWGCCFSLFNVIKEDIEKNNK